MRECVDEGSVRRREETVLSSGKRGKKREKRKKKQKGVLQPSTDPHAEMHTQTGGGSPCSGCRLSAMRGIQPCCVRCMAGWGHLKFNG